MLPEDKTAIPPKWVFSTKEDAEGVIVRFKARLVIQGFRQREGIDYDEIYSPTSKIVTFRTMMAVAADLGLEVHHVDVRTAFLNGKLDEEIYMKNPEGYVLAGPGKSCRLLKSLYGLKQAPRVWHQTLESALIGLGYKPTDVDPCLYTGIVEGTPVFLLAYVDDLVPMAKPGNAIQVVKSQIMKLFECRDLGPISLFLGIKV